MALLFLYKLSFPIVSRQCVSNCLTVIVHWEDPPFSNQGTTTAKNRVWATGLQHLVGLIAVKIQKKENKL